jgi:EAL domain-containing protein (putative c-di-GMP-specific phosphodiesterase class I)
MVWNRNIYGTYILTSYNEELIEGKYENKTINIYSNPPINSDRLFETIPGINNRYSTAIETISEIFKYREIKKNQSSMILIQLSNSQLGENYSTTNIYSLNKCGLCEYLRANLTQDYIISIPLKNHILISFNKKAEEDGLSSYLDIVSKLIDEFKYRLVFTRNLNYLITTDIAEDDDYTYQKMIFNVFAAMHYLVRSRNLRSIQYSKKMKQKVIKDKLIRDQLENAFTNDEFYMNYQILKSVDGNRTTGVEALLRWNNPILGNVPPMEFIPIIEDSYFINQLSVMVVTKVVNDLTNCYELFPKDFRVSINLTNYDFHNEFIIKKLINIILESKIPTYHFCFEITESGYLENTIKTKDIIDYLHSINIQIAIDDFGTGFSSLSSLKNVNADKVKIDRTFIKDYPQADNGLMHKTIAFLIKSLGYKIVIEGIETKAQLELAKATDCDEYQGFIITKPKDYVDFYEDLKKEFEEKTTK